MDGPRRRRFDTASCAVAPTRARAPHPTLRTRGTAAAVRHGRPRTRTSDARTRSGAARQWSPHDRPGPEFEHVLDARTPLLARAFECARPLDDDEK